MSLVREALKQELQDLMQKSVTYVSKRNTAKTDYKKELYTKKLVKNNLKIAAALEALNRLPQEGNNEKTQESGT